MYWNPVILFKNIQSMKNSPKSQWAKTRKKVYFDRIMHCLPQRLKSTFFEKNLSGGFPKEIWSGEKISKNVDFILWGNHATITSMFFGKIFFTPVPPFGNPPLEKISKNVEFSLWGKQCICPARMRPKLWKSHIV